MAPEKGPHILLYNHHFFWGYVKFFGGVRRSPDTSKIQQTDAAPKDFLDDQERFQVSLVKILNRADKMEPTYDSQVWLWQKYQETEIEKDVWVVWCEEDLLKLLLYVILLLHVFSS